MITLESLVGVQMISADAYDIGEITDVRYDPFEWNILGLKIKSKRSDKLAAGTGKGNFLIRPDKFVMNDVMLLSQPVDRLKDSVVPDNPNISSLSVLMSSKVVTKDNLLVGTITTAMIDAETWKVKSVIVRLDKTAIEAMKMKKGLFAKINVEIRTELILSSKDMVHLSEPMESLRGNITVIES